MSQAGSRLVGVYFYETGSGDLRAEVYHAWSGNEINDAEYYEVYANGKCLTEGDEPYETMPSIDEVKELLRVKDILP